MITCNVLFSVVAALGPQTGDTHEAPLVPVRAVQRFDSQWVVKANELLQEKNLKGRVLEDVAAELAGYGSNAIQAYFAILAGTVDGPTREGARRPSADALDPAAVLLAALARMKPKEVAAQIGVAASGEASLDVRIVALRVLETVGADGGVDAWIKIVSELDPRQFTLAYVQGPCERALSAVVSRDATSLPGLKDRLGKVPPGMVPVVLRGISTSRRPQALPVLTGLLGRMPAWDLVLLPSIGRLAEDTVGDLSDEELTWIRPFTLDQDWRVRREALILLGRVGDWRSHALMTAALADDQRLVQQAAAWALAHLSHTDLGLDASAWTAWFEREIGWFEQNGSRWSQALDVGDPALALEGMREWAGHALFRHDAARAIGRLLARTDAILVSQACTVLSGIKSPAACPALVEALGGENASIREAARATLAAITGLAVAPDATRWRRALAIE